MSGPIPQHLPPSFRFPLDSTSTTSSSSSSASSSGNNSPIYYPSKQHLFCNLIEKELVTTKQFLEVLGFILWIGLTILVLISGVILWVFVFDVILRASTLRESLEYTILWCFLMVVFLYLRTYLRCLTDQYIRQVMTHAEIFVIVSLVMVISTNVAFYLHSPMSHPLTDLGFLLIPEFSKQSWYYSLSDILTVTLPIIYAFHTIFMSRKERAIVFCTFFRLVTICYSLRALTVPLTSLPGPALHCRLYSSDYNPPTNWLDIVTRVGPLHGKFNTCGDLIFSGHMCYTNSALLLYLRRLDLAFPSKFGSFCRWILGIAYLLTLGVLCIAGRKHYTVDVVLGIIISTLVYFHFENGWKPLACQSERRNNNIELQTSQLKHFERRGQMTGIEEHCEFYPTDRDTEEDEEEVELLGATSNAILSAPPVAMV